MGRSNSEMHLSGSTMTIVTVLVPLWQCEQRVQYPRNFVLRWWKVLKSIRQEVVMSFPYIGIKHRKVTYTPHMGRITYLHIEEKMVERGQEDLVGRVVSSASRLLTKFILTLCF